MLKAEKAGVDSAWKQEKLEARKMLENAAREAPQRPMRAMLGNFKLVQYQ
jgi:hypothetical protein